MARFSHLATQPERSIPHILKWKVVNPLLGRHRSAPVAGFRTPRRDNDGAHLSDRAPHATWIGHATFVLRLGGKVIATDPNWARAMGPRRRLSEPGLAIDTVREHLDVVVVSHNHRDHLDQGTIRRLGPNPTYVAPLGNADALRAAGARTIVELDWWQTHREGELDITLVPARHWSMRMPWDRNAALWGGFVLRGPEGAAYHSGDTGMFDGFREIAERAGPIDWAMLPIGAYAPRWFMSPQHICPEEAGAAFEMLGAKHLLAMHWGTFKLTDEPLDEPPARLREWAKQRGYGEDRVWVLDVGETRRLL